MAILIAPTIILTDEEFQEEMADAAEAAEPRERRGRARMPALRLRQAPDCSRGAPRTAAPTALVNGIDAFHVFLASAPRLRASGSLLGVSVVSSPSASAQAPARGQNVVPVYEGFWRNADGSFDLLFGYYNRNWDEEIDVPDRCRQ